MKGPLVFRLEGWDIGYTSRKKSRCTMSGMEQPGIKHYLEGLSVVREIFHKKVLLSPPKNTVLPPTGIQPSSDIKSEASLLQYTQVQAG